MIQLNNTNVIINKNKDKHKLFLIWDAKEAIMVMASGYIALRIGQLFSSSAGLVLCALVVALFGGIFIEVKNHLTVYQVIQRWYRFTFQTPHKYYHMALEKADIVIIRERKEKGDMQ